MGEDVKAVAERLMALDRIHIYVPESYGGDELECQIGHDIEEVATYAHAAAEQTARLEAENERLKAAGHNMAAAIARGIRDGAPWRD